MLQSMVEYGIGRNNAAKELIGGCTEYETTYRAQYSGIVVQCLVDGLAQQYAVELKTCRSIGGMLADFFKRGYHIQAAWYNHVLRLCGEDPRDVEFIAVSKDAGRECTVMEYKIEECERVWTRLCMPGLERMLASIQSGIFENKYGDVMPLTTPEYIFHG
jgi:hypothetical protein